MYRSDKEKEAGKIYVHTYNIQVHVDQDSWNKLFEYKKSYQRRLNIFFASPNDNCLNICLYRAQFFMEAYITEYKIIHTDSSK